MELWEICRKTAIITQEAEISYQKLAKKMKKIFIIFTFCILFGNIKYVYADSDKVEIFNTDIYNAVVTMEDIYELNEEYLKGESDCVYWEFLSKRYTRILATGFTQTVVDGEGYGEWHAMTSAGDGLGSLEYKTMHLIHKLSGEIFDVSQSKENLQEYFEKTLKISKEVRTKAEYILKNLNDDQYGGMYYDRIDKCIHVWLKDEALTETLTNQGYICEQAEYSNTQLYEITEKLWEEKQSLGINGIVLDGINNGLSVYAACEEDVLDGFGKNITLYQQKYGMEEGADKLVEDVLECDVWDKGSENEYKQMENAIRILKQNYPSYHDINLLLKVAFDGDEKRFLDFDKELLAFVETLPTYQPISKNPFDEMLYGDPERLQLKSRLREYKNLYADMDYQQIYQKYLSDWEDTSVVSMKQKQFHLIIERNVAELKDVNLEKDSISQNKNNSKNEEEKSAFFIKIIVVIIAGAMVGVIFYIMKKKSGKHIS